ncbi:MAG TPA: rhodanese-like domain-containing protein [Propionibacteriaceae bacterium]|nr:rhodanese-like domain-containing protein [Propionibacteriaceae bacterium]
MSVPEASDEAPAAIDLLLEQVRATLQRVPATDLPAAVDAGALIVDIRPVEQRERDGEFPGAVVVDRNVLEWRLDPTSQFRLPEAADPARRIIIVCSEGYSSSLAAATLQQLGRWNATDLIGGFQAWLADIGTISTGDRVERPDGTPMKQQLDSRTAKPHNYFVVEQASGGASS